MVITVYWLLSKVLPESSSESSSSTCEMVESQVLTLNIKCNHHGSALAVRKILASRRQAVGSQERV